MAHKGLKKANDGNVKRLWGIEIARDRKNKATKIAFEQHGKVLNHQANKTPTSAGLPLPKDARPSPREEEDAMAHAL